MANIKNTGKSCRKFLSVGLVLGVVALMGANQAYAFGNMGAPKGEPKKTEPAKPVAVPWKDKDCILKIGKETFTYADLKKIWSDWAEKSERNLATFPVSEQEAFFNRYYYTRLFAQGALKEGLEKTELFNKNFKPVLYREFLPVFRKLEVLDKIKVTDDELVNYLPPALPEVQLRIIVKSDAAKAKELYDRIKKGEDFATLAKKESEGMTAQHGGMAGFFNTSNTKMFPPSVTARFLESPIGYVSEPFFQDIGFMIVKVEAKHSADELRRQALKNEKTRIIKENFFEPAWNAKIEELFKKSKIVTHEDAIQEIVQKNSGFEKVVLEINGEKFTGDDLAGELTDVPHGDVTMENRIRKFSELALIGQEALKLKLHEHKEFSAKYKSLYLKALQRTYVDKVKKTVTSQKITDAEFEAYIKQHPDECTIPAAKKLSAIVVLSEDDVKKCQSRLGGGESYSQVAKEMSTHAESAQNGGDMGFLDEKGTPPEVWAMVAKLKVGEYTNPPYKTETPDGKPQWIFVRLDDERKSAPMSLDRVKSPTFEGRIYSIKQTKALQERANSLIKEFGYEFCMKPQQKGKGK